MKIKLFSLITFVFTSISIASYSQWSNPVNLSPGTTSVSTNEDAGQCMVVVGDTIRITYSDRSTAMVKIMYNQSHDMGITWGTPVQVFSSLNCGFTAIASSGSTVHLVWMDSLGATRGSYYRQSLDGGATWGAIVCLDSFTKFWPGIACVGNLVIATLNKDLSGNTEVFIKRSLDNGTTWLAEQQISHAANRSEDPAIAMLGNDVHLSWNDKRSGTMNIYYCHSSDGGATWGPETGLTTVDSYTSMVCLDSNHVDVPHGIRVATYFDVDLSESADTGTTFIPNQNLTNTSTLSELYPFMVRDGMQMHCVYMGPGGCNYLHSSNGGLTWDAPVLLSSSGQPFIAYTGCVLHVMFTNAGYINYMRNPTGNPGNCTQTVGIKEQNNNTEISISPNPATSSFIISSTNKIENVKVFNVIGECIEQLTTNNQQLTINSSQFVKGIYFVQISDENKNVVNRKVVVQ